jgi:hypothetical protein
LEKIQSLEKRGKSKKKVKLSGASDRKCWQGKMGFADGLLVYSKVIHKNN